MVTATQTAAAAPTISPTQSEAPAVARVKPRGRFSLPGLGRRWRSDFAHSSATELRRPRILFVNQYYWPDHASTAQHLTDLCESLAEQGFEVHVLCSRGAYLGKDQKQERSPRREIRNGVHIHRVWATALGRRSTWARMTDYLSYYAQAMVKSALMKRFDVVTTLTTPPIIGLTGTMLRWLKRSKHVYWSMDLHPDASFALGRMSPRNPLFAALGWLSDLVYRNADRVVTLGPYMSERILAKRALPDRIAEVPVWSRRDEIYPMPREGHPLRSELGLESKFVVMYSGNLGLAHTFDEFLEAARKLRNRDDIVFLFVGGGPRLKEVREAKDRDGLDNVRILDYFPREQLHISLSVADVHLISMRPEMTGIVVPGKLYGIMASCRPALFVGPDRCESADAIAQANCGRVLPIGDAEGVASTITEWAARPELVRTLGANGRAAFLDWHERDVCCRQWGDLLKKLVGMPATAAQTTLSPSPPAAARSERPLAAISAVSGS